jgi:hypothetical protein
VSLLGFDAPLTWQQANDGITVTFPTLPQSAPATTLKLTPKPSPIPAGGA